MDITVSELMSNFMESPLVVWVKTLGPLASNSDDKLSMFMELVDGVFLHKIMTHIDPSPMNHRLNKQVNNDVSLRIQNLSTVIRHIKSYYQENLQHLILMNLPNVLAIAKDPLSGKSMEEMKKLLLLLLGCAVQCDRKEEIIEKIKLLDIETQAAIVSHIQEVTDSQENVLDLQWLEEGKMCVEELDSLSRTMAFHLRKLIDERDECSELVLELTQEKDYLQSQQSLAPVGFSSPERPLQLSKDDRQHLAVELADTKGKLRRSRQELEEKTEQLMDTKNELDRLDAEMQKQKQENLQLLSEARSVRAYRDEVDALRERAGRVDRLETELARFKERLHDVHFYKARVEELREDNVTLLETKTLLEEQLSTARGRCDKLHELEKENLHLRSKLHDMEIDRDSDKKRLEELLEENMLLEISQKQSMNESAHLGWELEQLTKNNEVNEACKSFVFELNETASSRLLKLEKENQSLQSTIQELREASRSLEEGHVHAVELERENRTLKKKVEGLQTQMDQEKQITHDLENQGEELKLQKQKLEKELESLQADRDKQISELQQEKQHLSQTVSSLRMRAQADSEARVRDMEAENRVLHQTISETGVRLARLEADKRQAAKELDGARERAEGAAELEREVARLERGREQLQRELAALAIAGERAEELARENATLEQDNRRLRKQADAAQGISARLATLEADRRQLEEQNLEQRRALEVARPAAARLAQLQHEHSELEGEHAELRAATEELRAHTKRLELGQAALEREKEHLRSSLDASGAEAQGARAELREAETRAEVFRREAEELRRAAERVDEAERARLSAEQELAQAEKERRQLEKEARRLRQQMEAKEAALEESSVKVASMEKESTATGRELARLREASTRVKEQEKENKELQKQATIDKRTLATLREELVNEKLRVQQQHNELEMLSAELEKIGLSREKLLQEEHSTEDSKYKILETKIESTLKKTLELKEEKVQGLESRLEESSSLNQQLRTELAAVKKTLEALRQRQEEEAAHSEMSQKAVRQDLGREKWELEQREATAELLKHKDHLITVEKSNAALETEKHLLKAQLKQLDSQNAQLNAQTLSLQKQVSALQEHNSALHKETAKLQVENSTLSSQSLSLATQYGALQAQLQAMEAEAESLRRERVEARSTRDAAAQDHEHLLAVHERQAAEYEQLITQHATLKASQRTLEQEYRGLQSKYTLLLKQKDAMEELEVSLQRERDSLGEELQKNAMVLGENRSLREEMDRLVQTHTQLRREYDGLQLQSKELKTSLNESQLELNRWQARYDQLKEQHQGLDISMTKLDNHCELLTRLKGNLEEENHHLLSQIQMLSQQNQTLLERTMESKELYHEEQKQYIDKLNSLRRQKEKLEEKIMDQYKFYEPSPKKRSHWVGAKAIAKLIKPKKEALRERPDGSRERLRSAPDIPLPDIPVSPHCLDGSPPLHPPPLPPRQGHLSLDRPGNLPAEENHIFSQQLDGRGPSDCGSSRGREGYRPAGGSSESMNGYEELTVRRRGTEPGASCSTPLNHSSHSATGSRPGRRPKGLISEEDQRLHSLDAGFGSSGHGNAGSRPSTADYSRNTSSSSSPVNSKDSLERLQRRSASLSSDDAAGMGPDGCRLSQSSLLPRSSTLPCDAPPIPRSAPRSARHRGSSPGSEMVTLEEFLQESNALSPPSVQTGSREDLMSDYFTRTGRPAPLRDGAKTPTSYVTPTVKTPPSGPDGRASKPGHSVKPSMRLVETSTPPSQSQTLPNRGASGPGGRPSPLQQAGPRGVGGAAGLSRTFSLASADLLHSTGPESYRPEAGSPSQAEGVVRRQGLPARERPHSARLAGTSPPPAVDPRRLSVAPPRDELSLHSSAPLQVDKGPGGGCTGAPGLGRPAAQHHRGEVAMVTPVRAVSALKLEEVEEPGEHRQADLQPLKKADSPGCGTREQPSSSPASPDHTNDPQTVWYEYGCV
ncbi:protein Daple isoform X1 [Electrophorus electricus]|uniref:protein Daple isoform X1 n=1 Tax=Electrophorus electricus TaxID=8005 RepID=UPI0015CFB690|nr:protein Daple isoform X1 [Electrophorus electricus]